MMKILVSGGKGMLGTELVSRINKKDGFEAVGLDKNDLDITSQKSIQKAIEKHQPKFFINAAAYTDVEACEEPEAFALAVQINGYGVGKLAQACKKSKINLMHISSDYVFGDNDTKGYRENYINHKPLNKYGESKVIGEEELIKNADGLNDSAFRLQNPRMYIVRVSWLFGNGAVNFIKKISDLGKERDELSLVTDEVGSPTYIKDLAERIIWMMKELPTAGIYHIVGNGKCSRYEFAQEIKKHVYGFNAEITETTLSAFPRKATIPNMSYLVNTKLEPMRNWQEMVADYLS